MEPVFLYDFNSPYAYLAASRVDAVLGTAVRWQPIAFAFLLTAQRRVPWSLDDRRDEGVAECERRAREYGLPPMTWPAGWPKDSYTLDPLRGAIFAGSLGLLREYTDAAFARNFVTGDGLLGDAGVEIAVEVGLDEAETRAAIAGPARAELKGVTEAAIAAGVHGVPTVRVGREHFWGDDQLEAAAHALAS